MTPTSTEEDRGPHPDTWTGASNRDKASTRASPKPPFSRVDQGVELEPQEKGMRDVGDVRDGSAAARGRTGLTGRPHLPTDPRISAGSKAESLLDFVTEASSDIKDVLHRSAPRNGMVDHSKYLLDRMEQASVEGWMCNNTNDAAASGLVDIDGTQSHAALMTGRPSNTSSETQRDAENRSDSMNPITFSRTMIPDSDVKTPRSLISDMDRDPLFQNITMLSRFDASGTPSVSSCSDIPGVPLRKRQLPASFWIEPNRPRLGPYPEEMYAAMARFHRYQSGCYLDSRNIPYKDTTSYPYPCIPGYQQPGLSHMDRVKLALVENDPQVRGCVTAYGTERPGSACCTPYPWSNYPSYGSTRGIKSLHRPAIGSVGISPSPLAFYPPPACLGGQYEDGRAPSESSNTKPPLWKPVPTKSLSYGTRYHPFGNVR